MEGQECQRHRSVGGVTRGGDPGWRRRWRGRRRSKGRSVSGAEASRPSQGEGRWNQGGGGLGGSEEVKRSGAPAAQKRQRRHGGGPEAEQALEVGKGSKALEGQKGFGSPKASRGGGGGGTENRAGLGGSEGSQRVRSVEEALEVQKGSDPSKARAERGDQEWRRPWGGRMKSKRQKPGGGLGRSEGVGSRQRRHWGRGGRARRGRPWSVRKGSKGNKRGGRL